MTAPLSPLMRTALEQLARFGELHHFCSTGKNVWQNAQRLSTPFRRETIMALRKRGLLRIIGGAHREAAKLTDRGRFAAAALTDVQITK